MQPALIHLPIFLGFLAFGLADGKVPTAQPTDAPRQSAVPKPGDADFPNPRPGARHDQKVAAVKSGDFDLVMIGDSITQCLGDSGGEWEPVKAVWNKHYAHRKAINLGYSGYRTEDILWNLQHGELDFARPPKVFRILIGTNNLDDQHYKSIHSAQQVFAGTKAIVDLIRGRFPEAKILVLRILPSGGKRDKTACNRVYCRSDQALAALREAGMAASRLADGKQVFWMDINHVFLQPDGTINPDLMPDLIHPNAAGHEAMARAIEPEIARWLGDGPVADPEPNTAIVPAAKLENDGYDWMARHQDAIRTGETTDPEWVFVGDSITHAWGGLPATGARTTGEGVLKSAFPGLRTLNLGFGWDRTQNVLWRIDHGEFDRIRPRTVVLNIGTNNTSKTANARDNTPAEIVAGIRACVIRIRSKLPETRILVMRIFPREERPDHPRRKTIDETNRLLAAELGKVEGVTLLDIGAALTRPDGTISREIMPDFCHLTPRGYQIWADAIRAGLAGKP